MVVFGILGIPIWKFVTVFGGHTGFCCFLYTAPHTPQTNAIMPPYHTIIRYIAIEGQPDGSFWHLRYSDLKICNSFWPYLRYSDFKMFKNVRGPHIVFCFSVLFEFRTRSYPNVSCWILLKIIIPAVKIAVVDLSLGLLLRPFLQKTLSLQTD